MAILIDAYNVLHCTHVLPEPWAMVDVQGLADLISQSGFADRDCVIVCDGLPRGGVYPSSELVEIMYAGGGRDADTLIEKLVDEDTTPRQITVVSNDRRLQKAARRRRGKWLASERFLALLAKSVQDTQNRNATTPKPVQPTDVNEWLDAFDIDPAAARSVDVKLDLSQLPDSVRAYLDDPPETVAPKAKSIKTFDPDAVRAKADEQKQQDDLDDWYAHFSLDDSEMADLDAMLDPFADQQDDQPDDPFDPRSGKRQSADLDDSGEGTNFWLRQFGYDHSGQDQCPEDT